MSHVERTSKYTKLAKLPDKNADFAVQACARVLLPLADRIETITYDNGNALGSAPVRGAGRRRETACRQSCHHESAVDDQIDSGDIRRIIRDQKCDRTCDIRRCSKSAKWDASE